MPIKGLTNQGSGFPRLGKLRKGAVKPEGRSVAADLDYFRFVPTFGDEAYQVDLATAFRDALGPKPTSFHVYMAYDTTDETFRTSCDIWDNAGTLLHRCDGETVTQWWEGTEKVKGERPCKPGEHGKNRDGSDRRPIDDAVGHLWVVIPELLQAGYVGTVELETHSKNDIAHIDQVLRKVESMNHGHLTGIPFTLFRQDQEINTPGFGKRGEQGKRSKATKSLVKLIPEASWVQSMLEGAAAGNMLQLDAGDQDDEFDFEGEIVEDPESSNGGDTRYHDARDEPTSGEPITKVLAWFEKMPPNERKALVKNYNPNELPSSPKDARAFWKQVEALKLPKEYGTRLYGLANGDFQVAGAMLYVLADNMTGGGPEDPAASWDDAEEQFDFLDF